MRSAVRHVGTARAPVSPALSRSQKAARDSMMARKMLATTRKKNFFYAGRQHLPRHIEAAFR
jgi:hypothetical protein